MAQSASNALGRTASQRCSINRTIRLSEHRVGNAPIAGYLPGLDGIEMSGAAGFCQVLDAPVFIQLRLRRLNVTRFIRGTRHDHGLLSIPLPVKIESGM